MTKKNSVRAAAIIGITASTLGLASCASSHQAGNPAKPSCTQAPKLDSSTPTVAVLAQQGTTADAYRGDVALVIRGAQQLKARLLTSGIGTSQATPSLLTNSLMVGDGNNSLERKNNLACKEQAVSASLDQLRKLPEPNPLDDVGALKTLEGTLTHAPKGSEIDVVLLGSMLNMTAVDLSKPEVLDSPTAALNTLAAAQLKPNCTGWRVSVVGGGQTTPPLDDAKVAQLREFWRQYFAWCGGALVSWSPHLDSFPVSGGAIPEADTTQIPIKREADKVTATLSGDVLFDAGRNELRPAAGAELNQVLTLVGQEKGRIVIDGYTDVGGDEADNIGLSQRRAATVMEWLNANGVDRSRISPVGHGSTGAKFVNPTTPDEHQANRRVEITVYTN